MQKLLLPLILLLGQGFTKILALTEILPGTTAGSVTSYVSQDYGVILSSENRTGCGRQIISHRIVGGADSANGEWPWQVSLQRDNFHLCGGSIITESWVLTAAHCFETSLSVSTYTVYLGVYQLSYPHNHTVSRKVKQIIVHPDFTEEGSSGDIALVELENPLTFTPYILPICLPSQSVKLPEGTMCWATGWGDIQRGVPLASPKTLQKVKLPLIDNNKCESMYQDSLGYSPRFDLIKEDMICAGYKEGQKDSCQGDSGGPLVCSVNGVWLQVGIISWGHGCAEPNHPGVYTRVQYYQTWVQNHVPNLQYSNGGNSISNSMMAQLTLYRHYRSVISTQHVQKGTEGGDLNQ